MEKPDKPYWVIDGLDWTTEFTPGQWTALQQRYAHGHGLGNLTLDRFAPFMHALAPHALKRYRLWVDTVARGTGLDDPAEIVVIVMLHYYCTINYPQGILYELNAGRRRGMSKQQASDIFALAWLHSGPFGMNTAAVMCEDYMTMWAPDWDPADRSEGFPFPSEWKVDPEVWECGIDFTTPHDNVITDDELAKLVGWHEQWEGEVPAYVGFLADNYPAALLAFRARFETTLSGSLPREFVALCRVHIAASQRQAGSVRRAVHMARELGVSRDHVVQMLALTQVYMGDSGMDGAIEGAAMLAEWK